MSADKIAAAISKWSEEIVAWDRWHEVEIEFSHPPFMLSPYEEEIHCLFWKFVIDGKKYSDIYHMIEDPESDVA